MNCFYHKEKVATCVCNGCGKGLCSECANVVSPPLCGPCIAECASISKKEMVKSVVFGVIAAVICCILLESSRGIFFFCVPFGWYALNRITPNIFLVLPLVGWVVYFVIKFMLSALIGWIAVIIKMREWICNIYIAKDVLG